jgi:hypothetical protein
MGVEECGEGGGVVFEGGEVGGWEEECAGERSVLFMLRNSLLLGMETYKTGYCDEHELLAGPNV